MDRGPGEADLTSAPRGAIEPRSRAPPASALTFLKAPCPRLAHGPSMQQQRRRTRSEGTLAERPGAAPWQPSPPAAPASARCHLPERKAALAAAHAPDVSLPLRFILSGIVALVAYGALMLFRPEALTAHHYNPYALAATHLVVLGWMLSVVAGALYQLVPVALETRLCHARLARWHFALHVVGVPGMVWAFWKSEVRLVAWFGTAVAMGVGCLAWNLARTLRRSPHRNAVWLGIASSVFWLVVAMLAGLCVVASKLWQFTPFNPLSQMHAHAHAGVLGCFVMLIVSVSYKLVPMFALGEVRHERRARRSVILLNAGTAAVFAAVLLDSKLKPLAALLACAGLVLYALELRAILRARKRRELDLGLKCFLGGVALLAPVGVTGVALSWPGLPANAFTSRLENAYGLLALLGVVSLTVLGMLHKIVPFLAWFAAYSGKVGQFKVPKLGELYSHRLQAASIAAYAAGLAALTAGTLLANSAVVRTGALAMLAGMAAFVINVGLILRHCVQPRCEPLVRPTLKPLAP